MSYWEDTYGSILQEVARGKSPLSGLPSELPDFPRFEHAAIGVRHSKGGLFSKGGATVDDLRLDLHFAAGWVIVSVETNPDFAQFHLQRRHNPGCQCADCADWKQFRARLQTR